MRDSRIPLVTLTALAMVLSAVVVVTAQSTALERGYRTGYSDGYNAGYVDKADGNAREFKNKTEYQRGDRSYNQVWGPIEDYRDGYQQGFESGYAAGFDRTPFNSSIPTGLARRENQPRTETTETPTQPAPAQQADVQSNPTTTSGPPADAPVVIRQGQVFTVELLSPVSTDVSQKGDRFKARVVEPQEFGGAIVEGRVVNVKRPGKVKGRAELQLTFEQIHMPDNRVAPIRADLVEVIPMGGENVGDVDAEGGVKGRDSTKDDVTKVGAATGIGAIIGAIAGGGKGAAIGAVIGGGAGTAGVMTQRGHDIRLSQGQQLKIRTSSEAQL
jgi:hypothetical protein